jgi:DNA-binding PadR family transcriptional regulator
MAKNSANAPLTPAVLHILLALSNQERHGYGIMKQVESDSQGKVKMGPGTLYGSLGRMIDAGLIRESDKKVDPKMDDERRVYYKITGLGQKALAAELQRYREVVAVARRLSPNALSYGYGRGTPNRAIPALVSKTAPLLFAAVPRALCREQQAL